MWCFGYDPKTGKLETGYVLMTLLEPVVMSIVIAIVWWKPLRDIVRTRPRALVPYMGAAAVIVLGACAALFGMRAEARADDLPFPARSIRTALIAPKLELTDQDGTPFSLEKETGRVVLVTGVYASCGFTCPMIMGQAKRALAALTQDERREITVAAITLDPEHDDEARLQTMARAQMVAAPAFHLLWGPPAEVNTALDDFSMARTRDPKTGQIDHANLFILVDRSGKIAYRLTLGTQQERWLIAALRTLLGEAKAG
jgi:cytochrome oxidase Cu insertion factor (SCO1/SenC/PrrC family)